MNTEFINALTAAVEKNWTVEMFAETLLPKMRTEQKSNLYDREYMLKKLAVDKLEAVLPSKAKLQSLQIDGSETFKQKVKDELAKLPFDVQCFVHARCAIMELSPALFQGFCSPRGKLTVAVANDLKGFDFRQVLYHEIAHGYLRHRGGADDECEAVTLSNKWL